MAFFTVLPNSSRHRNPSRCESSKVQSISKHPERDTAYPFESISWMCVLMPFGHQDGLEGVLSRFAIGIHARNLPPPIRQVIMKHRQPLRETRLPAVRGAVILMSTTYHTIATASTPFVPKQSYNLHNRVPLCVAYVGGLVSDSRDGVDYTAIQSRCVQTFSGKTSNHSDGSYSHSTTETRMCPDSHTGTITKEHGTRLPVRHNESPSGLDATMTADWPPIGYENIQGDDESCHDLAHAVNQSFRHTVLS